MFINFLLLETHVFFKRNLVSTVTNGNIVYFGVRRRRQEDIMGTVVNYRSASDQSYTTMAKRKCWFSVWSSFNFPNEPGNWNFDLVSPGF